MGNISNKEKTKKFSFQVINPLYVPTICCICLENIHGEAIWCKHCNQPIHKICLKKWKKNCPLCRK